ncbi:hypothetical protein SpCBS45565_g01404 [Spizellomyces sp. 'palustris']|nr:hypothetical protein SpCBS45565_g01404 [Spizellomyces sp. 'palustris']
MSYSPLGPTPSSSPTSHIDSDLTLFGDFRDDVSEIGEKETTEAISAAEPNAQDSPILKFLKLPPYPFYYNYPTPFLQPAHENSLHNAVHGFHYRRDEDAWYESVCEYHYGKRWWGKERVPLSLRRREGEDKEFFYLQPPPYSPTMPFRIGGLASISSDTPHGIHEHPDPQVPQPTMHPEQHHHHRHPDLHSESHMQEHVSEHLHAEHLHEHLHAEHLHNHLNEHIHEHLHPEHVHAEHLHPDHIHKHMHKHRIPPPPPTSSTYTRQKLRTTLSLKKLLPKPYTKKKSPSPSNKRSKQVTRACNHCKKAHLACDDQRPCRRCKHLGKEDCMDVEHKRRGRPRNSRSKNRKRFEVVGYEEEEEEEFGFAAAAEPEGCEVEEGNE